MSKSKVISIPAQERADVGKGASRRLRRANMVPAVVYGADRPARNLVLEHDMLFHAADDESFYSSILELQVDDGRRQKVIVRDMQRHPVKIRILHIDFLRIKDDEELRITVPLHFINEGSSPAGSQSGVVISHQMTDVEILALPENLPEYIEVDLAHLDIGTVVMLSEVQPPEGVTIAALSHGDEHDQDSVVASAAYVSETVDEEPEAEDDGLAVEGAEAADADADTQADEQPEAED